MPGCQPTIRLPLRESELTGSLTGAGRHGRSLVGRAGASWNRPGWAPGSSGWDLEAGTRRQGAKQVDAVAGVEGDAGVGVAQRVVVQDRHRHPARRPGGLAECVADGGRAGADGDLHDLVAA